jgi:hypothetical protein
VSRQLVVVLLALIEPALVTVAVVVCSNQGGLVSYRASRNRARRKFWKLALFTSFLM